MPRISGSQIAVYGAVAVALLLVGVRSIRSERDAAAGSLATSDAGGELRVSASGGDVVVHVAGAVRRPGVYRLPAGARVTDAVRRAGGAAPTGMLDAVNLAARLADGQQVVIPAAGAAGGGALAVGSSQGPISLGTASVEQLDTIDGIGPVTARDIIDFRDQHGGLASVEQLDQISGIGPATMEALRERLQP